MRLVNIHNASIFLLHDNSYISFTARTISHNTLPTNEQQNANRMKRSLSYKQQRQQREEMKSVCFTAYNQSNPPPSPESETMMKTMCMYAVILRQTVRHSKPQQQNEVSATHNRWGTKQLARNPCNPIRSSMYQPESSKRERRCLMMIKTHKIDVIYLVSEVDDAAGLEEKRWREVIKYQLLTLFETI